MTITVRATSTGPNSTAISEVISLPAGTVADDLTILVAVQAGVGGSGVVPVLTAPSGWTVLVNCSGALVCYRKFVTADPTSVTITSSVSDFWMSGAVSYIGVDTTTPIDAAASCLSVKDLKVTLRAPSVVPNWAADRLVGIFIDNSSAGSTITLPAGMTARLASTAGPSFRICDKALVDGTATGDLVATGPVAGPTLGVGCSIALKSAGATAATPDPLRPIFGGVFSATLQNNTTLAIPFSLINPVTGDLQVVMLAGPDAFTSPAGWTQVGTALGSRVYTKRWTSGDTTTPVFTPVLTPTGNYTEVDAFLLRSGSGSVLVTLDTSGAGTGLGAATAPSLPRAQGNELLVTHFGGEDSTIHTWSAITAGLTDENLDTRGPNTRFSWLYPAPSPSGAFSATLASSARNDAWAGLFGAGITSAMADTPGAGAITVTGFVPTIDQVGLPVTGAITFTGFAPTIDQVDLPPAGAITFIGFGASGDQFDAPDAGAISFVGFAPTAVAAVVSSSLMFRSVF